MLQGDYRCSPSATYRDVALLRGQGREGRAREGRSDQVSWGLLMGITLRTHKMLWGRAANRCSFPDCRIELAADAVETDDDAVIGEACHISAQREGEARWQPDFPPEQLHKYDNLILLCRNHHKTIDDMENEYPVRRLHELRAQHERWVRQSLETFDPARQRDDELYAWIVEEWAQRCQLHDWDAWTSYVLGGGGQPSIGVAVHDDLWALHRWLYVRLWPHRYENLETALENFRQVLQDFLSVFDEHAEERGDDRLTTRKFYKGEHGWLPDDVYWRLGREYEFHCMLVEDLMLELTRAANLVCDCVRTSVSPFFRLREGSLWVMSGPHMTGGYHMHRPAYTDADIASGLYGGLGAFLSERRTRDVCFGIGTSASDPAFLQRSGEGE